MGSVYRFAGDDIGVSQELVIAVISAKMRTHGICVHSTNCLIPEFFGPPGVTSSRPGGMQS